MIINFPELNLVLYNPLYNHYSKTAKLSNVRGSLAFILLNFKNKINRVLCNAGTNFM